jgi:hypothetical protein
VHQRTERQIIEVAVCPHDRRQEGVLDLLAAPVGDERVGVLDAGGRCVRIESMLRIVP